PHVRSPPSPPTTATLFPYTTLFRSQGSVFGLSLDRVAIAPYNSPLHHFTNPRGDVDGIMVQTPTSLTMTDAMESVREVMRGRRKIGRASCRERGEVWVGGGVLEGE